MASIRQKKFAKRLAGKTGSRREVSGGRTCLRWRPCLPGVIVKNEGRFTSSTRSRPRAQGNERRTDR